MKIVDGGSFTLFVSKEGLVVGVAPPKEAELGVRPDVRHKREEDVDVRSKSADAHRERNPLAKQVGTLPELPCIRHKPCLSPFPHTCENKRSEIADSPSSRRSIASYIRKYRNFAEEVSASSDEAVEGVLPTNTTFGYYVAAILLEPITLTEWQGIVLSSDTWEEAAIRAAESYRGFPLVADGLNVDALRGFRRKQKKSRK